MDSVDARDLLGTRSDHLQGNRMLPSNNFAPLAQQRVALHTATIAALQMIR
jgi:hypothetical protein